MQKSKNSLPIMSLATYLYNSEGDVLLNDVRFHSVVLLQVPYFQAQRRFHEENKSENIGNGFLLDDFSPEATRVLKQILYEQPIAFDFKNVSLYGEIFELIRRLELKVDMGALVKQLDEVISDDARFFLFEKGFDHFDLPNVGKLILCISIDCSLKSKLFFLEIDVKTS